VTVLIFIPAGGMERGRVGDAAEGADSFQPRLDSTHTTSILWSIFLPDKGRSDSQFYI
jgi:hypothetical protein